MTTRLRVLSVEDSENDAELVRVHLKRSGWEVVQRRAETAEEMTAALDGAPWDIVVADYSLPQFDAVRALALLEDRGHDIPLIVVSGTVGEARAVELMRLGARDFVLKDDLARLSPAITRELGEAVNRKMRRQAERDREELIERLRRALEEAARLNLSLEEAHRSKDQFLATVSHELRTPLTAILGWARIITTTPNGEGRHARAMNVIERNAHAMTHLVEDLLDFAGASRGQLRLRVAPVDLVQVVDETIESSRVAAQAKGVQLERRLDANAARVIGDASRLQQVLWNLVSNAVKFTPPGGRVDVTLARAGRFIELSVTDTGQGIGPEFLPFVFEPFRQADSTPMRAHGGLGLGLSIARHLIDLHGGRVDAQSDGPGRGARFVVRLPVGNPATERSEEGPVVRGLHVLVVEDDPAAREVFAAMLEDSGSRVSAAATAAEAIAAIDLELPDVVLVDIGVPGENG
jgi:signal transduction histidine kinase